MEKVDVLIRKTGWLSPSSSPWRTGLLALAAASAFSCGAQAQEKRPVPPPVQQAAAEIAAELATNCPLAPAGDVSAYTQCRQALFGPSRLRAQVAPIMLWGRQNKKDNATLRQTNLTQFAPDAWTGMYAPLFMFNGRHTVEWVADEKMFLVRLEAAFRNRLPPGQFPYPFWHEEAKWAMYENARTMMLWMSPDTAVIKVAQFTDVGPTPLLQPVQAVVHEKYQGPWIWTDDKGRTQPAVTLFDGLYRPENPYLGNVDKRYRDLALQMRESQCVNCHVPNNPDKMSRLVLLSTPAHAAAEVDRLIKAVREDRMPMDEFRLSYALSEDNKKWLLESALAFKESLTAARQWEDEAAKKSVQSAINPQKVIK